MSARLGVLNSQTVNAEPKQLTAEGLLQSQSVNACRELAADMSGFPCYIRTVRPIFSISCLHGHSKMAEELLRERDDLILHLAQLREELLHMEVSSLEEAEERDLCVQQVTQIQEEWIEAYRELFRRQLMEDAAQSAAGHRNREEAS